MASGPSVGPTTLRTRDGTALCVRGAASVTASHPVGSTGHSPEATVG